MQMAIIEYLGPFKQDGSIRSDTICRCVCNECGAQWQATHQGIRGKKEKGDPRIGQLCKGCNQGMPIIAVDDVLRRYSFIVKVIAVNSSRNSLNNESVIEAECGMCHKTYEISYRVIKEKDEWYCQSCAQTHRHGKTHVYPQDVEVLLDWDRKTLGKHRQLIANSRVLVKCKNCSATRWLNWTKVLTRSGNCHKCRTELLWQREDYRAKMPTHMGVSNLHLNFKSLMVDCGITGFESEKWIGRRRVDERNEDLKLVILVQGRFWHGDPRYYNGDDVLYNDKTARQVWQEDREYIADLNEHGYSVLEIWEDDINSNPDSVISDIIEWINQQSISSTLANNVLST
jgi:very-short-patch-repair endonuclease